VFASVGSHPLQDVLDIQTQARGDLKALQVVQLNFLPSYSLPQTTQKSHG